MTANAAAYHESPVDRFLERLERVKPTGPGRWSAACPGPLHNRGDRNPSLSITIGDDGRVLLKCFVGCDKPAILAAIGLQMADLFPPRAVTHAGPIPAHRRPKISDRDLIKIIVREVSIVATAGEEMLASPMVTTDIERLRVAVGRLSAVLSEAGRHG